MKYNLKFSFVLRGKIPPEAKKEIDNWLDELHAMFAKGIKETDLKEISRIKSWDVKSKSAKEDELILTVVSGGVMPPHHALLRMRKFLAQKLGKTYRVGIGNVEIKSYKIDIDIPNKPEKEFSLPFV
ncbi:MAG: hypothetical protein ACTSP7_03175, partial [Candidatus Heimdallarchaeota archaeon]